jgi:hypothetical protein
LLGYEVDDFVVGDDEVEDEDEEQAGTLWFGPRGMDDILDVERRRSIGAEPRNWSKLPTEEEAF